MISDDSNIIKPDFVFFMITNRCSIIKSKKNNNFIILLNKKLLRCINHTQLQNGFVYQSGIKIPVSYPKKMEVNYAITGQCK